MKPIGNHAIGHGSRRRAGWLKTGLASAAALAMLASSGVALAATIGPQDGGGGNSDGHHAKLHFCA